MPRKKAVPPPVEVEPEIQLEELECQNCSQTWTRPRSRGGPRPVLCPSCREAGMTTTKLKRAATEAEVSARLDKLDSALRASGSHLSQVPEIRRSYNVQDMDRRITALESLVTELLEAK